MNIHIHEMVERQREKDLQREAAQRRLAYQALKHRRAMRGSLRRRIGNFFAGFGQRLRMLARAG